MNRKTFIALGAAAAVLTLAACSSGSPEPVEAPGTAENAPEAPESTPTVEEPGTAALDTPWVAESYSGAVLTVEWNVDPTDDRLVELEAFREANGAEPVSYSIVDVDNRQGTEYQNLYPSQIFDEAGEATELVDAEGLAGEWAPKTIWSDDGESYYSVNAAGVEIPDDLAVDLNAQWAELELESGAEPGQRVDVILVGPEELPAEAATVLLRDASAYPVEGE